MPTTRPRIQVTETPPVEHALDVAARRWPGAARSELIVRLIDRGAAAIEAEGQSMLESRLRAMLVTAGSLDGVYAPDELERLRGEWPE